MTPANPMADILSGISSVVSSAITWLGQFVSAITSNPLVLLFVIVAFVGLGIGLLSRLIHL